MSSALRLALLSRIVRISILLLAGASSSIHAVTPGGRWEGGLFIPHVNFDIDAKIEDLDGVDDAIENEFGYGLLFGYNFSGKQAVILEQSWIDSRGEDRLGMLFFDIATRFTLVNYRYCWTREHSFAPFVTAGVGAFGARVRTSDLLSTTGPSWQIGAGLDFPVETRASIRLFVQQIWVDLETDLATNLMAGFGASFWFGSPPDP